MLHRLRAESPLNLISQQVCANLCCVCVTITVYVRCCQINIVLALHIVIRPC